ncbi:MAG: hypothetical protein M1812_005967 [Candelaria pacifica]|nr:MAG: hypothetical protein M1812_005967 [Candelaria pacifica]
MTDKYILKVTAGPAYDPSTHKVVSVNSTTPTHISNAHITADINVRIQNYRGLPSGSPSTSPYFSHPLHASDSYSISFTFIPSSPINGADLEFGNDFDHPVRDKLPPGFNAALRIAKWAVDPGLDGDVYADRPYLFGSALSSVNVFWVGGKAKGEKLPAEHKDGKNREGKKKEEDIEVIEEGGDEDGKALREQLGVPPEAAARKKWFLQEEKRKAFTLEEGRIYKTDFFNPYLDFNEFALNLPGFHLPIMKYWDGQPLRPHSLRYVLKNRTTGDVYLVVLFTLVPKEEAEKDGYSNTSKAKTDEGGAKVEARGKQEGFQPQADDLD